MPETVKSGIFLPNMAISLPLFPVDSKKSYNINGLRISNSLFTPENSESYSSKMA